MASPLLSQAPELLTRPQATILACCKKCFPPISLPVIFFALIIGLGTTLLHHPASNRSTPISWSDALFTSTSAVCVTGLTVVDTGSYFTRFGKNMILGLIQIGRLGIMTFSSLAFYLWRRRVSITDQIAVGQSLIAGQSMSLIRFLKGMLIWTLSIELVGAAFIDLVAPKGVTPYAAIFHAISAFCNAGFSLYSDNLMGWQDAWLVNLVIMALIVAGGIGFSVLIELGIFIPAKIAHKKGRRRPSLSWQSSIVLRTTYWLIAKLRTWTSPTASVSRSSPPNTQATSSTPSSPRPTSLCARATPWSSSAPSTVWRGSTPNVTIACLATKRAWPD